MPKDFNKNARSVGAGAQSNPRTPEGQRYMYARFRYPSFEASSISDTGVASGMTLVDRKFYGVEPVTNTSTAVQFHQPCANYRVNVNVTGQVLSDAFGSETAKYPEVPFTAYLLGTNQTGAAFRTPFSGFRLTQLGGVFQMAASPHLTDTFWEDDILQLLLSVETDWDHLPITINAYELSVEWICDTDLEKPSGES